MKKLKASNGSEDSGTIAYKEEALKNKFEEFKGQEKTSKVFTVCSKKTLSSMVYEDSGTIAYMEEALKNKFEELKGQKRLPSCSPFVQLARITQGNNWDLKIC
ncbi:hypothetical protein M9H77_07573 [Catharanthus roseus]|uniref:Uncharacterized protein n=1 Tax=Catharanthus roseus TaxID=4058 RepID=A0ACC0BVM1_CATRO|nr:hypothetical protein M9H77_07573 [Catharanthus roseus]